MHLLSLLLPLSFLILDVSAQCSSNGDSATCVAAIGCVWLSWTDPQRCGDIGNCADNCGACDDDTECESIGAGGFSTAEGGNACLIAGAGPLIGECIGSFCANNCENCFDATTCDASFAPPNGCEISVASGSEECIPVEVIVTDDPTEQPTTDPTEIPTRDPTQIPTTQPTTQPTTDPSQIPTSQPTINPTEIPTSDPSNDPTTGNPSVSPTTSVPTSSPIVITTSAPITTSIGTTATGEPCCCSSASESDSSSSSEGRRRRRLLSSDSDSDSVDDPCASLSASDSSDGGTTTSPGTTCICPGSESDSSSSSDDEAEETEADALFAAGTVDKDIDNGIDALMGDAIEGEDGGEYAMYVSFTKATYLNAWGMVCLFLVLNGLCCVVCYKKKKVQSLDGDRVNDLEASNLEIVS